MKDVPELLMKGERLIQPETCSLELYMIIIKTWMVEPESRPSFQELHKEFRKMSMDPGKFLAIPGDHLMRLPDYNNAVRTWNPFAKHVYYLNLISKM